MYARYLFHEEINVFWFIPVSLFTKKILNGQIFLRRLYLGCILRGWDELKMPYIERSACLMSSSALFLQIHRKKYSLPFQSFGKKYIFDRNSEEKGCIAERQALVLLSQGSGGVLQLLSAATLFASYFLTVLKAATFV